MRGRLTARSLAGAQVHPFQARIFDVALSTFGAMFFDDPAAAFGNLRPPPRPPTPAGWVGALVSGAGFGGIEFAKARSGTAWWRTHRQVA